MFTSIRTQPVALNHLWTWKSHDVVQKVYESQCFCKAVSDDELELHMYCSTRMGVWILSCVGKIENGKKGVVVDISCCRASCCTGSAEQPLLIRALDSWYKSTGKVSI